MSVSHIRCGKFPSEVLSDGSPYAGMPQEHPETAAAADASKLHHYSSLCISYSKTYFQISIIKDNNRLCGKFRFHTGNGFSDKRPYKIQESQQKK